MLRTTARLVPTLLAACLLGGCSIQIQTGDATKQPAGQRPPPPPPPAARPAGQAPTPAPTPVAAQTRRPPAIPPTATRINAPNAFGNGKSGAFQGLVYVIPDTSKRLPPTSTLVPFAALFTDKFEIQSQDFSSGFPGALMQNDWFLISYEGPFNVPQQGKWQFQLTSDDGAKLYIDDKLVVDNDGLHTAKAAQAEATLTAGQHWLKLEYFQGARGQVALSLLMGQGGKLAPLVGGAR